MLLTFAHIFHNIGLGTGLKFRFWTGNIKSNRNRGSKNRTEPDRNKTGLGICQRVFRKFPTRTESKPVFGQTVPRPISYPISNECCPLSQVSIFLAFDVYVSVFSQDSNEPLRLHHLCEVVHKIFVILLSTTSYSFFGALVLFTASSFERINTQVELGMATVWPLTGLKRFGYG